MKKSIALCALAFILFTQATPAYALTWSDVKEIFVGTQATSTEETQAQEEQEESFLEALVGSSFIEIAQAEEVDPDGINKAFDFEIETGDTLWNKIDQEIGEMDASLEEQERIYTIDRVVDELRTLSQEDLEAYGISSGDIDLIYPGETIAFAIQAVLE